VSIPEALIAFSVAAILLTITPGLDTALVLRTAAVEGPRTAWMAALGIFLGSIAWATLVGVGLGALFAASQLAFEILKWVGAAYLVWLGLNLVLRPRERFDIDAETQPSAQGVGWLWRGALNNLLNPKVGVFYVSFLPQFTPPGVPVAPWMVMLAAIHCGFSAIWFGAIIAATQPIAGALRRAAVVRWLDRLTGGLFLAFGVRLALERR
jgi:threonine/homoserine/homoserine lactone efflux protein